MGRVTDYPLRTRWKTLTPNEFELREAARFSSLSWQEFDDLPGTTEVADLLDIPNSKCAVVAYYRMSRLYDAVMLDLREKYPPPVRRGR